MEVGERIRSRAEELTSAERRVAEAVLAAPQAVAFGTVADLARAASVGAASVVRLATKLGFEGYSDLQQAIQDELTRQLRPAAERIREGSGTGRTAHATAELSNIQATLDAAPDGAVDQVVERLADLDRPVVILSGEASAGVTRQFAGDLGQLRPGVATIGGSDVAVRRQVALVDPDSTLVVVDLRRYERWLLEAHRALHDRGVWSVGLTDGQLSPIASRAAVSFQVTAGAVGPFDSHVGTLSLLNLFVAEVAGALRTSAAERLSDVERAWRDGRSLTDR